MLNAQVSVFSPNLAVSGPAFCLCSPEVHKGSYSLLLEPPQRASHGVGCMWVRQTEYSGTHEPSGGDPQMKHPQQLVGRLPDGFHKVVSKIHVFLMPSESPVCCSPRPSLPKWCRIAQYSGWVRKKRALLAAFHTAGKPGAPSHSQSPP